MELTKIIRASDMKRKVGKIPRDEGYTLPASSEKGVPFIDFNEVLKKIIPTKVKIVKKKRVIILERIND